RPANAQPIPATTKERMRPGPALSCAASPVSTKMPAPMMAPTPRAVRLTGPSTRRSRFSPSISASSTSTGLTAKSWLRRFIPAPPPGRSLAATPPAHARPGPARERDHQRARHAGEDAGGAWRGDERAALDQEEVRAGRLRDLAARGHVQALGGPAARGDETAGDGARVADQLQ